MYDVIVIGGGLSGLSAALSCADARLKTLLVARKLGGKLPQTPLVEGIVGLSPISGPELARRMLDQALASDVETANTEVMRVQKGFTLFNVTVADNTVHKAKCVILASGRGIAPLGIVGEDEFIGKGVTQNPVSDYEQLKEKTVAVYGSGDSAALCALWLSTMCPKVYLLIPGQPAMTALLRERLTRSMRIQVIQEAKPKYLAGTVWLERIHFEQGAHIDAQGLVLVEPALPELEYARQLGITITDGFVVTDGEAKTPISGVLACGDCSSAGGPLHPVFAMADGTVAGMSAAGYVKHKKWQTR